MPGCTLRCTTRHAITLFLLAVMATIFECRAGTVGLNKDAILRSAAQAASRNAKRIQSRAKSGSKKGGQGQSRKATADKAPRRVKGQKHQDRSVELTADIFDDELNQVSVNACI